MLVCLTRRSVVHGSEACNVGQSYLCTCVVLSALIADIVRNGDKQPDPAQRLMKDCNCVPHLIYELWKCYARFLIPTHQAPLHHVWLHEPHCLCSKLAVVLDSGNVSECQCLLFWTAQKNISECQCLTRTVCRSSLSGPSFLLRCSCLMP